MVTIVIKQYSMPRIHRRETEAHLGGFVDVTQEHYPDLNLRDVNRPWHKETHTRRLLAMP